GGLRRGQPGHGELAPTRLLRPQPAGGNPDVPRRAGRQPRQPVAGPADLVARPAVLRAGRGDRPPGTALRLPRDRLGGGHRAALDRRVAPRAVVGRLLHRPPPVLRRPPLLRGAPRPGGGLAGGGRAVGAGHPLARPRRLRRSARLEPLHQRAGRDALRDAVVELHSGVGRSPSGPELGLARPAVPALSTGPGKYAGPAGTAPTFRR